MFSLICNNVNEIASFLTIAVILLSGLFWSHRKLHNDITTLSNDVKAMNEKLDIESRETAKRFDLVNQRMDQKMDQANQRMDQANQRMDQLYNTIIELLHRQSEKDIKKV